MVEAKVWLDMDEVTVTFPSQTTARFPSSLVSSLVPSMPLLVILGVSRLWRDTVGDSEDSIREISSSPSDLSFEKIESKSATQDMLEPSKEEKGLQ